MSTKRYYVVVLAVIVGVVYLLSFSSKSQKITNSPCGNVNLTTPHHRIMNGNRQMFSRFDDGKRVWRIKGIKPPMSSDGAPPVVDMELEFERSPENCAIWKREQGIRD